MKNISLRFSSYCLVLFLLLSTSSKAQWQYVHPKPQGNTLTQSCFPTGTTGWLTGNYGTIIKTIDGGQTWFNQYSLQNFDINDFSAPNATTAYFIAADNQLYASGNGGNSWLKKYKFQGSNVTRLCFISNSEGWATQGNSITHTTDGGVTWNVQTLIPGETFADVKITPTGEGFAITTTGTIATCINSGQTWNNTTAYAGTFNATNLLNGGNFALAVINSTLYKSNDNGATWTDPVTTPAEFSTGTVTDISLLTANDYYATLDNGVVVYSHDGGTTWSSDNSFAGNVLNGIVANQSNEAIAYGNDGTIIKTTDNGVTWNRIGTLLSNEHLYGVTNSTNDVYAVGDAGTILKSTNQGSNWAVQNSGTIENLRDVIAINSTTLIAVGENGMILKSTNGGSNWNIISNAYPSSIYSITRLPNGTLYAAGADDLILTSTDNGDTWNYVTTTFTGFGYAFTEIQFVNNDTGYVSSNSAEILMTDDGGANWYLKSTGVFGQITCMYFQTGLKGWVGTNAGEIFNTNDGGNTWTNQSVLNFTGVVQKIRFTDVLNGWAFTDQGIDRTADGGTTWTEEFSPYPDVQDAVFINNINAVAVGGGRATILQRSNNLELNLSSGAFCTDHTYTIVANSTGTFNPGNMFSVQLSDDFGDFSNPLTLGSLFATTITSLPAIIPGGLTNSNAYKMRIASTNPPMYSAITGTVISINTSPEAFIVADGPTAFCVGSSVTLSNINLGSLQYQWYNNGVAMPGETNDSLFVTTTGNYTLSVNDGICETLSPIMDILVTNCSGIAEQDQKKVMIAPNPADDFLNIIIANGINYTKLSIMEMTGRTIQEFEGTVSQKTHIDVSPLPAGVYLIKLSGTDDSIVRFVKK